MRNNATLIAFALTAFSYASSVVASAENASVREENFATDSLGTESASATLLLFERYYSPTPFMHRSDTFSPGIPFGAERQLGHVYSELVPGAHPIFQCFHTIAGHQDYFTSQDVNCEGYSVGDPYRYGDPSGWLMTNHVSGTVPLYRCIVQNIYHFDSLQSNCEGYTTEGILGYIYQ